MVDIRNIEDILEKLDRDEAKEKYIALFSTGQVHDARDFEKATEDELQRLQEDHIPAKINRKDQDRLSMFYAGKKRRKGGGYA